MGIRADIFALAALAAPASAEPRVAPVLPKSTAVPLRCFAMTQPDMSHVTAPWSLTREVRRNSRSCRSSSAYWRT